MHYVGSMLTFMKALGPGDGQVISKDEQAFSTFFMKHVVAEKVGGAGDGRHAGLPCSYFNEPVIQMDQGFE